MQPMRRFEEEKGLTYEAGEEELPLRRNRDINLIPLPTHARPNRRLIVNLMTLELALLDYSALFVDVEGRVVPKLQLIAALAGDERAVEDLLLSRRCHSGI